MKSKANFKLIKNKVDKIINLSNSNVKKHPYLIVIIMHELFRSIYPYDPYITNKFSKNPLKNLDKVLDNLIKILNLIKFLGSYDVDNKLFFTKKINTQKLFGKLWKERLNANQLNSLKILQRTFKDSNFNPNNLKGKKILDMGCGSGRFTLAFSYFKPKLVYGLDLGDEGIKIGKFLARKNNLKNVKFVKGNVLNLPFKKNYFDFIFCKGVLHHTKNLKKGLNELFRVLKSGGKSFLYLYGSGGIFWYARSQMRKVMKKISIDYTIETLRLINMPPKRTIFVDSWYVPIEQHVKQKKLEKLLTKNKILFKKINSSVKTQLESMMNKDFFKDLYGEGELRYFISKQ